MSRGSPIEHVETVAVAGLAALALAHGLLDTDSPLVVVFHSGAGWLFLAGWPLLLLCARRVGVEARDPTVSGGRRLLLWSKVLVAGLVVLAHLIWVLPRPSEAPGSGAPLRVVVANLYAGNPDVAGLVAEIEAADPDVMVALELTSRWVAALDGLPLAHREILAKESPFGIGLYARFPMATEVRMLEGIPAIRGEVQAPGGPVAVYAVHPVPPIDASFAARRRAQIGVLRAWLEAETGPWVAGGDLNLTPHDPLYGALVGGTVRDAYASCGRWAGWTWPNGILPLIRLDHVLHGTGVGCVAVQEGAGTGSDHRPVIADLVVR